MQSSLVPISLLSRKHFIPKYTFVLKLSTRWSLFLAEKDPLGNKVAERGGVWVSGQVMRSQAYTIQQTLTTEAASVLKHSLALARRRGHSQVTPLHVAATLLSTRSSLLRRACLKSQQHPIPNSNNSSNPLRCRAVELCFNVALNRLPTSPPPLLHGCPATLSNSLIAALKRAQAHKRRGCIEQQQQQLALLAVKVELEQLVISILDDPSVSRVFKEAGISSTSVKINIEDDDSSSVFHCYAGAPSGVGGVFSSPSSPTRGTFWQTQPCFPKEDDMKLVLEVLLRKKKRNVVVVGDSLSTTDGLVAELMGRVERGDVPNELKSVQFIKFMFAPFSFSYMKLSDVDSNVTELKKKIDSILEKGNGVIVYAGELTWASEDKCGPVGDHLVWETGKMLSGYMGRGGKVWLIGTSNLQTYMRLQEKEPPLEVQWGLQAVSAPSGGLGLSLQAGTPPLTGSSLKEGMQLGHEGVRQLTCRSEFPNKLLGQDDLFDLKRKWNGFCHDLHLEKTTHCGYSYSYLSSQTQSRSEWPCHTDLFPDGNSSITFPSQTATPLPRFRRRRSCTIEFDGRSSTGKKNPCPGPNLDSLRNPEGNEMKITLSLGNSLFSDSGKLAEHNIERMLQQGNARRLLHDNVPWQSETIPAIVEALFHSKPAIRDTWLLLHGNDTTGKRRLARAIAEAMFGSSDLVINLNTRAINSAKSSYSKIFARISKDDEKLVVLVENIEMADKQIVKFLSDRFETGKISDSSQGRAQDRGQVVYILTKGDSFTAAVDDRKRQNSIVQMAVRVTKTPQGASIDLKKELCNVVFDLNEKASGEIGDKDVEEVSPNSSDLTGESGGENMSPEGFNGTIENRFSFGRSLTRDREMRELFMKKIRGSFEEVYGGGKGFRLHVEEWVLEGIEIGSGFFLNSLFEKWLKDTFQTAMHILKSGLSGRDVGISFIIILVLGDKGEGYLVEEEEEEGYMNTCLPNFIQIPLSTELLALAV